MRNAWRWVGKAFCFFGLHDAELRPSFKRDPERYSCHRCRRQWDFFVN